MRKKLNKRKQDLPLSTKNILGILISSVIGVITTLIITFASSLILKNSAVLPDSINILFIISVIVGALVTGFIASKQCSFKGLVSGLISSLPYLLIIITIMLFFSQGKIEEKVLLIFIGVLISTAIGGIISANTKRRK